MTTHLKRRSLGGLAFLIAGTLAASGISASQASAQPVGGTYPAGTCLYADGAYSPGSHRREYHKLPDGKTTYVEYVCKNGSWEKSGEGYAGKPAKTKKTVAPKVAAPQT
jgi:hypothetical protein